MAKHDDEERRGRRGRGEGRLLDRILSDVASWFDSEPDLDEGHGGHQPDRRDRSDDQERGSPRRYRGVGPKGYKRSPEQLEERIAERLGEHDEINAAEIEIEISGDEVTLKGKVPSRRQKRLAEDCAESVLGIRDVHNRLTIDPDMERDGA